MNRKTFLQALFGHCIRTWREPAASLAQLLGDSPQDAPPIDLNALFLEAMRQGIDPAAFDERELLKRVTRQEESADPAPTLQPEQGGDVPRQPGTNSHAA